MDAEIVSLAICKAHRLNERCGFVYRQHLGWTLGTDIVEVQSGETLFWAGGLTSRLKTVTATGDALTITDGYFWQNCWLERVFERPKGISSVWGCRCLSGLGNNQVSLMVLCMEVCIWRCFCPRSARHSARR
jgi:hypothetical protein